MPGSQMDDLSRGEMSWKRKQCGERHERVISSDFAETNRVREEIVSLLAAWRYGIRDQFAVRLAVDEALANAVNHGNRQDPSKKIRINFRVTDDLFEITVEDEGEGFVPEELGDPLANEYLERPCGRGLPLMHHFMSDVAFHPPGNKVTLRKLRTRLK